MPDRLVRYTLRGLLGLLAVNAFAGGWYAMAGAEGVPRDWLEGTAFSTYRVPGLILFAIVGGTAAIAAVSTFAGHPQAAIAARLAGWTLVIWLAAQVSIIGLVSWLQPITMAVAVAILVLTYRDRLGAAGMRQLPLRGR
jgi:hypothetical protein